MCFKFIIMEIKKINDFEWKVGDGINFGVIFASEELVNLVKDDKSLNQVLNVSRLPGVIQSFAMPDIHQGYGFPIGGVAAFDLENGVISPGGVGYDINCSVRLLKTNLKFSDIKDKEEKIADVLFKAIPNGVGVKGKIRLNNKTINDVLIGGASWAVENGYGKEGDLDFIEDRGVLKNVNPKFVSDKAKGRGMNQLGTLGAGNHFVDVLKVEEIFDDKVAQVFGLEKDGIVIMIHCGSRGLGHQVASDYIGKISSDGKFEEDRELAYVPIKSELGEKYFGAMNAAANFSFANKQVITHYIRESMKDVFENFESEVLYEVTHNIAKTEKHQGRNVLVIRKGATRSFGPDNENVCEAYRKVGQPVLIPGSMGTLSYVMVGTANAEKKSFGSSAHGAGRSRSRSEAKENVNFENAKKDMKSRNVVLRYGSEKSLIEEYPESYKNIDEVIEVVDKIGLSKKVVSLKPLIVILG